MKKSKIFAIAALVVGLTGSVAHAGNFIGSGAQGIAIPGLNQPIRSPLLQCQVETSQLRGQVSAKEEEIAALQDKVSELQAQVNRLTPGTCENSCSNVNEDRYGTCVYSCQISRGFIERDSETAERLSRS